jgi:ATP-dependent DNA helicase 2 subunit 1
VFRSSIQYVVAIIQCYVAQPAGTRQKILLPTNLEEDEELEANSSVLPESISISRVEDLLNQMRIHEIPKRALFSIPFQLADGLSIGVKG